MKQTFSEFLEEAKLVEGDWVEGDVITESVGGKGVEAIVKAMGADFMSDTAKAVFTTGAHFISNSLYVTRRSYNGNVYTVEFIDITDGMKRGKKLPLISVNVDYENGKDVLDVMQNISAKTFKDVKKYLKDNEVTYGEMTVDGAFVFNPWTYATLKPVKTVGKRPTKITVAAMIKNGQYDYVSTIRLGRDDSSSDYMDNGAKSFQNAVSLVASMYPGYVNVRPKISLQEDFKGKRVDVYYNSNDFYSVGFSDLKPDSKKAIV